MSDKQAQDYSPIGGADNRKADNAADLDSTDSNQHTVSDISEVHAKLEQVDKKLEKLEQRELESDKKSSRLVIAAAFAYLGFKVTSTIAGLYHLIKQQKEMPGAEPLGRRLLSRSLWATVFKKGLLWGSVGAVVGAVLGWKRGDRLNKPMDLITKPIESIGKIFSKSDKNKNTESAASQSGVDIDSETHTQPQEQQPNATSDEISNNWRKHINVQQSEQSHIVRTS